MLPLLAITGLLLGSTACRRDPDARVGTPHRDRPCAPWSGITARDVQGAPMGDTDSTDWVTRGYFCPAVDALFPTRTGLRWVVGPDSTEVLSFPNPCSNAFMLVLSAPLDGYLDVRVVNAEMEVLAAIDSTTATSLYFNTEGYGLEAGELFRVYYRQVGYDSTLIRGSGDLRYQP